MGTREQGKKRVGGKEVLEEKESRGKKRGGKQRELGKKEKREKSVP